MLPEAKGFYYKDRVQMKIGFIGCVESSKILLQEILDYNTDNNIEMFVITKENSSLNSDFYNLSDICSKYNLPFKLFDREGEDSCYYAMQNFNPEILFCCGWSHLLSLKWLNLAKLAIGFHPSPIPIGRGRHPLIWALALGLKDTASTFFEMVEEPDAGMIISQKHCRIVSTDDACSLYQKIMDIARVQIIDILTGYEKSSLTFQGQQLSEGVRWRKRTEKDGIIDWRMHASDIHNLVRALVDPYPCASFYLKSELVKVKKTKVENNPDYKIFEPGRILKKTEAAVLIKCADATAIWIYDCPKLDELFEGGYVL